MKQLFLAFLVFSLAGAALAQGTRLWKQTGYEDFERGTARGVAVRSSGQLELAPVFKVVYTSPSTFVWSIAADKDGVVYAATGAPARVYRITPDGKASVIFEPKELQVQAIALGKDGAIYAATSPDGKVYKLVHGAGKTDRDSGYVSSVFFDPQTKYIWDLAFDAEGQLYVATGDNGQIFRVDKAGHGGLFFKSDEAHIRVLAFDPKGNLIAGSDGSALVYRISPAGQGFVLYAVSRKEVTALAVDHTGNIYVAATGKKQVAPARKNTVTLAQPPSQPVAQASGAPFTGHLNLAGSDLYMIAPDGLPKKLWSSKEDIVYALGFDATGRLIAGTGNKGHVYAIDKNGVYVDLLKASASQVTAFAKAPGGGLYCSSSNLGKIFLMTHTLTPEGTFESDVHDARIFSRWGRAEVRGRGNFELFARSGNVDNPDRNWSPWTRVDVNKDARLDVPAARFVQWRAVLRPSDPSTRIEDVAINYLSRNVAPVLEEVSVLQGARFLPQPRVATPSSATITFTPQKTPPHAAVTPPATPDRSYVAVRWKARDDNDDNLTYSLYYRGDNERAWKLLKSGLTDKFYSFDSGLLPDGGYIVKVVASDAPSHTPEEALTDEKESSRFAVDNTSPRIEGLTASVEGQELHVTFHAKDDSSPIHRAEYSIDAGDWQYLEPVGQISDSKTENYDFSALLWSALPVPTAPEHDPPKSRKRANSGKKVAAPASGEHVVVVRVYDRAENAATGKYVVR